MIKLSRVDMYVGSEVEDEHCEIHLLNPCVYIHERFTELVFILGVSSVQISIQRSEPQVALSRKVDQSESVQVTS